MSVSDRSAPDDAEAPRERGAGSASNEPLDGSQQLFLTLLFNKYRGPLYRYLAGLVRDRDDAAELVQEAYFRLMRHTDATRFEEMARAYLFRTATNLARDYYRRRTTRSTDKHVELVDELPSSHAQPEEELLWQEMLQQIRRSIDDMPQDVRDVFLLSRFREKTYPEIAVLLNLSTRTVERRMAMAMELLVQALGADR